MRPVVLIYSKDPDFFLVFGHILSVAGFDSRLIGDKDASRNDDSVRPVAVVLDCQPNDRTVAKVCMRLKSTSTTRDTPIVGLVSPRAAGLHLDLIKAGVDETFSRPFAPEQLLSWLNAKASAANTSLETESGDLLLGDFRLERRTHRVFFIDTEIETPPIEFKLLRCLMANPGTVFSREDLITTAWPDHANGADVRSVDVHIARLRKRLKATVGHDVIRTVRSAGYAFAPDW